MSSPGSVPRARRGCAPARARRAPTRKARALPDDGYERLHEAIVSGRLRPNERLVESELARTFGLGRAAIRTALIRLEQEGLVSREPNRGAKVRLVSDREAVEILECRAALEGLAVRHAALNASPADAEDLRKLLGEMRELLDVGDLLGVSELNARLHRRLLEVSGHSTATRLIANLKSQMVRFQYRTILVPGRSEASFVEHTAVVDAVVAHDPDAAERAMRHHLSSVVDALARRRGESPE